MADASPPVWTSGDFLFTGPVYLMGGFQRLGVLYFHPAGIHFLAYPLRSLISIPLLVAFIVFAILSAVSELLDTPVGTAIGLALAAVCLLAQIFVRRIRRDDDRRRGEVFRKWCEEIRGRPIHELVRENKGSRSIKPAQIQHLRAAKESIVIRLIGRVLPLRARPLSEGTQRILLDFARERGWPIK